MKDEKRLKKDLIIELKALRKKVKYLEARSTADEKKHNQQNNIDIIIENVPDHITRFDTDGRLQYINPSFARDYSVTSKEVIGKSLIELSVPSSADGNKVYHNAILQVVKRGMQKVLEGRWITLQGERIFELRYIPQKNKKGKVVGVLGIARDITRRKYAEEKLRDSEERLRLTLETTQIGVWDWDIKNDKWYASPVYYTMLGYEPETGQADRRKWIKRVHPDDREYVSQKIKNVLSENFIEYEYEARLKHANGPYRWQYVRGFSTKRDEEGNATRMLGIRMDINERKLAEKAIQESRQRYYSVFENSPVSIWEEDLSSVKNFFDKLKKQGVTDIETYFAQHPDAVRECAELTKVIDVNRAALQLHEAANKEELLSCLANTFTSESFNSFQKELVTLWNEETEMTTDAVVKTLTGERKSVTVYLSVCPGYENTFSKVLVSLIDITERKHNEAVNVSRLHLIQFAETHSLNELLEETLNKAEELTESLIGFYHFVDEDQKFLTLQDWSTRTKKEFCKAEGKGLHYSIDEAGVWVDCVKQGKPVIHNDYNSLPHRKGMPEGHAEVIRELVVPVMRGSKVKAILGVGNKPFDYNEKDVDLISLLADLAWEIAERKKVDEALRRMNRELRAISNCNQTLLRASDEQTLLNEICRIICEEAGYRLAWVGYAEHDELKTIRPVACAGCDIGYIENSNLLGTENAEHDQNPARKAISDGEIIYIQDFETDPQMAPWRESALNRGYRSGISLPLKGENNEVFGVLMIYSEKPNSITADEIRLLEELSGDLAFGITTLSIREERKRTALALQQSNDMLRAIIEAAPTAIFDLDLDGNVKTIWNNAAEKMLGWSEQEAIGRQLPSISDNKQEEFKQFMKQIHSGKTLGGVEVQRQKKDGTPIDYCIYASPLYDTEGSVTGKVAVLMDITERKKAEKAILESERRFKNLANLLPQTIFEADTEGVVTFANKTALTTFGYSLKDVPKGINIIDMICEKDKAEAFDDMQRIMKNLPTSRNEYEMIRKDGTTFPALIFTAPIRSEGKTFGIRGSIVDITQRKQTENELRRLSEAVAQSPASIIITDTNGNIEYVNKTFEETTGYTFDEAIKETPRILKHENTTKEVYKKLWDTITSGNTWRGEFLNKKKDGTPYWEDATISPIKDGNNKIINYLAVKQDITDKKKITEELIKAKERAEESDKLKTEFLAQMSHEIRSPMNVTLSMMTLIKEELGNNLTAQISGYFDTVESAGKRLIRTVELILNSAEMQIGSYEPVWNNIDLIKDVLNPVVLEYQGQAKIKGLELIFTKKTNASKIYSDMYSTSQIFSNLIDNAIKYTPKGKVEIIIEKNVKDNTCVIVSDTGIGISEEFIPKLFEPFMQEERGYTRSYEGNGLGLALVKNYCDLNNAVINVESLKKKGTKFTVTFLPRS